MHRRILFGVAAWLLGAATATAGSLLAVSLLGQGITGGNGSLLTQAAVNRALASEAVEPTAKSTSSDGDPGATGTAGASPAATRTATSGSAGPSPVARPSGTGTPGVEPSGTAPSDSAPATPTSASTGGTAADGGTVLTSHGGYVVASCPAGGAYLDSWSPAQGFVAADVHRGPAQTVRVTFNPAIGSNDFAVTMLVSCAAGTPSATTHSGEPGDT